MCSPKTMFKIGIPIAGVLLLGYVTFPQFRVALAGLAPFAFFAICPLAMLFGMWGMKGKRTDNACSGASCSHTHAEHKQT